MQGSERKEQKKQHTARFPNQETRHRVLNR